VASQGSSHPTRHPNRLIEGVIRLSALSPSRDWPNDQPADNVAPVTRGGILPSTRAGVWILFVLALANGVFLYVVPGRADTDYAWSILPAVNAAFIGAGFLAGTLATGLVLFAATRWRSLHTLPPALWVLATTLLAATLIHNDRFKWDYGPTWLWLVVYAGVPFVVPVLVLLQQRVAEPEPPADPRLRPVRVLSAVCGALLVIGAAVLYIAPLDVDWPWALTPLLGRAVAAWYAMVGTMLLACAIGLRRATEAIIPYSTLAAWCLLLLALPLLHADDVNGAGAWVAMMIVLLALAAFALARSLPRLRDEGL
jgi:hypothetical protein